MTDYIPPAIAPGGDFNRETHQKHEANILALLGNFIDSAPPSNPVEGQIWIDNTDPTRFLVNIFENGVWKPCSLISRADANFDLGNFSIIGLKPQALAFGSVPAPSANTAGLIVYDTTNSRLLYLTDTETREFSYTVV